ncbi:Ras guanine-nucleotide exchange factors catalytic domain [Trinorchestia longiramus]|nr:Ras guanine-nucleotide exchange factors catalytic domain [Trinorchestia longiramus]
MIIDDKEWESILPASVGGSTATGDLVKPLMMLHPIEIARQLTLLEFDLYKSVKPSELVGNAWTSKDKDVRSPNLLKMIYHTNNVTHWLMRCIIDCENFEERVAAMSRVVEIMIMFYDLNNFSGLFEMSSALESASVHRLELTKAEVKRRMPVTQKAVYEEALELGKNHCKKYLEKLRSINPPCVPFFGMYLTNIMHIEVGNPDVLPPHNLINFSKRRKVADITGEIQQYQNQSYCLQLEPKIRRFLETLDPFGGMSDGDINNYLYNKSTEIEPKNLRKPLLKERRWPHLSLKSPGIKPRSGRSLPNPLPNVFSTHKESGGGDGGEDTPHQLTPTTPSTPCTPPPSAATTTTPTSVNAGSLGNASTLPHGSSLASVALGSTDTLLHQASAPSLAHSGTLPHSFRDRERCTDQEDSVFARVEIGPLAAGLTRIGGEVSAPLVPVLPPPPQTPGHLTGDPAPPPLPPRGPPRRRETSLGDTSPKVQQAPDAPQLPPRDASPPPLPPRTSTLPHKHHPPSSASHISSQSTHFSYNPPVIPPSIHSTSHSSFPGPPSNLHSSLPGPLSSLPTPPSRQFYPPSYQHRTSVPPPPVPSSSLPLHHHHHSTTFHHPSHHPPPPPPPPHHPVMENTSSNAAESTLKSSHIIPPARRRNPSVDMQAPPLSRRHTTNGPPLDDGPPLPPPRGPLIMRPTSAFAEQQL